MIIREDELLAYCSRWEMVKAAYLERPSVRLDMPLKDFLDYCMKGNMHPLYYRYAYYKREDYIITDEMIEISIMSQIYHLSNQIIFIFGYISCFVLRISPS